MTLTSANLKPAPFPASTIGLLVLGIAAAALWVGSNIMFPGLAPTGITSIVTRPTIHIVTLTGLWLGLQRTRFCRR